MALMKSKDDQGEMTEEAHAEWLDLQAKAWADRMAKTYGNKLTTNPTQAAKVLNTHFQRASLRTIEMWLRESDLSEDDVRAMVDDLFNSDF